MVSACYEASRGPVDAYALNEFPADQCFHVACHTFLPCFTIANAGGLRIRVCLCACS